MKKIGLFFGVLFMGLLLTVRAPVNASDWALPFSKVPSIIEMAEALFSGAKIDISDIINLVNPIEGITSLAEDLSLTYADRKQQTILQQQAIMNAFIELGKAGINQLDSSTDFVVPITYNDIAAYTNFDKDWYTYFNDNSVTPSPDSNYLTILDSINGTGYNTFKNGVDILLTASNVPTMLYFNDLFSYCNLSGVNSSDFSKIGMFDLGSIYIYSNALEYTYSCNFTLIDNFSYCDPGNGSFRFWGNNGTKYNNFDGHYNNTFWGGWYNNYVSTPNYIETFSGSLSDVLTHISYKFHNVFIYVDDVLWSAPVMDCPAILAPDIIGLGDLGLDTYDVVGLNQPDDLGLDIPNFIDWILSKVNQGVDTLSIDDAITDEAPLVKTVDGVRAIHYEDTRPIEQVIEIELTDPDPNPTPTPNPNDPDPPILKLPTFNMLPHNTETTVLSELIDATQKTVPEDLMNLIWNCFGLLIIGGLIYILHK